MLDTLIALAVLAFVLATAWVSLSSHLRQIPEADRAGGPLLSGGVRAWYVLHLQPFEERCVQLGIRPSHLSIAQLLASFVVGYGYAVGLLFTGGWILLVSGSFDILDGRLARRTNTGSRRGAFLDSVVDRYADCAPLIGLAVCFRTSWILWVAVLALVGTLMVSYTRARAEGLGTECKIGLLQRPERYVILGFGSMLAAIIDPLTAPWLGAGSYPVLATALVILTLLVNFTAVQRAVYVWRALGESPHAPA